MDLDDQMEFDHVVRVLEDGTVEDTNLYAPDVEFLFGDGPWSPTNPDLYIYDKSWTASAGHTGQYGYNGPINHPSEFIGGDLEKYILATPGLWVTKIVEFLQSDDPDQDTYDPEFADEMVAVGWCLLYKSE